MNPNRLRVSNTGEMVRPSTPRNPDAVAERKRMALHGFAQGKNTRDVARDLGITESAVWHWRKHDPDYAEQLARVLEERDAMLAEELEDHALDLARGKTSKDNIPYFPAIKHMLHVTSPKRHGDKKTVEHTGAVIHTLIPSARRLDALPLDDDIIDVPVAEDEE